MPFLKMPNPLLRRAVVFVCLFACLASGYEAEEHKFAGDLGSANAVERAQASFEGVFSSDRDGVSPLFLLRPAAARAGSAAAIVESFVGAEPASSGDVPRIISAEALAKLRARH